MKTIECVPNFSEGRNRAAIGQITRAIAAVNGIRLLNVESGFDVNRTVVTFTGAPEAVCEAAFRGVEKATEVIDMRTHQGAHPRFGATDVLPLVPLSGITLEETATLARALGKRIGEELRLPVFAYAAAAFDERRRSLARCRSGEYEGLAAKLATPEGRPDFGPAVFVPESGAVAAGARPVLVAFNVNLDTNDVRPAHAIAGDIRETGRLIRNASGHSIRQPGLLKAVQAIGWYIEEYGKAQVSMNLCDLAVTPLHIAFDAACRQAQARGCRVTGSELVGMAPRQALLDAGKYFLEKQQRPTAVPGEELIAAAVRAMGLEELTPFLPEKILMDDVVM
ncbi:MAG: glutamate formimidoyltransferase [Prevotellaceae bacterium]|jgi:glutamate formiminotransferase/formiminotetrahydrofolate cyclodeaminase|nr:glutamate formimidoyltransferase [Prevotellaceae bacterium]